MPHIPLDPNLPGITGLLNYRQDTALPIRQLTQLLLRGESTLTEGERELIATVVSQGNQCNFCCNAHTAAADALLGETSTAEMVKNDPDNAPVSEKMKHLLQIARNVQADARTVSMEMVAKAREEGATDLEIHDTVLIAALFCLYNKYVDGLASVTPTEPAFYTRLAGILKNSGYLPWENRYAALKEG
ncbi:peroxidase-related enzyme [Mucilaginibacter sp. BJC16-A38]|uniref:carboxymuconolactone decarboxylase family protein n=1 Tax=Mucilaginibacter phenanthrenivorans TaxID=1234842 RepID=UPI0021573618|nr:peroxidase-related enzyme [Mucilaginibacter phenanthrenivorans]MCR8558104.1 peroxidase-related enzyme [Mucilaginibacter phenanthrenivorans]